MHITVNKAVRRSRDHKHLGKMKDFSLTWWFKFKRSFPPSSRVWLCFTPGTAVFLPLAQVISASLVLSSCWRSMHTSQSKLVNKRLWLAHCPLPVGDRFVTVAVGDQMANWALCHVTTLHWGMNQSAQARLLNCRPRRRRSLIVAESSFMAPEGFFSRLTERERAPRYNWFSIEQLAYLHFLNLSGWRNVFVCVLDSLWWVLLLKTYVRFNVFIMLILADTFSLLDLKITDVAN